MIIKKKRRKGMMCRRAKEVHQKSILKPTSVTVHFKMA